MLNGLPSLAYSASDTAQRLMGGDRDEKARIDRADLARTVRRVYEGEHADLVEDALRARYHPDTFAALKVSHGIQTWDNPMRDIVAKIATAWDEGATYRLVDSDGNDYEDADGVFAAQLEEMELDDLGRQMDTLTEMHTAIAVGPTVAPEERTGLRGFEWSVHSPETFNLVANPANPSDYIALQTFTAEVERGVVRQLRTTWTSDRVIRHIGRNGRWEALSDDENPYRTIPFVVVTRDHPIGGLWCSCPGAELAALTIDVCCWETVLGVQGSGQLKVLAGEFKDFPPGQALRHCGVIDVGNAGNVNVLDFQTDVAGFAQTYIERPRQRAAVGVDLEADEFQTSGQPPSGEALKMRYWRRDRRAARKRKFLKAALVELFWVAQHVLAYQINIAGEAPIDGIKGLVPYDRETFDTLGYRFLVDVNDVTYPELAAERATREDRDLQMGLTNLVELYQQRNPDASPDEARRQVQQNLALNATLQALGAGRAPNASVLRAIAPRPALGEPPR